MYWIEQQFTNWSGTKEFLSVLHSIVHLHFANAVSPSNEQKPFVSGVGGGGGAHGTRVGGGFHGGGGGGSAIDFRRVDARRLCTASFSQLQLE